MAINKNATGYTFLFSIVMVLIVGAALAYTSLSLKPLQKKNEADNHGDGTRGQHGERADDFSLLLATTESFGRDVRICQR